MPFIVNASYIETEMGGKAVKMAANQTTSATSVYSGLS